MQYKITKQYAKDKELPLAELDGLNDSELFISTKLSSDEAKSLKLIYRLYGNERLLHEYNKENMKVPLARAQYAQGDIDLPISFAEPFRVLGQQSNKEVMLAKFCDLDDAKMFIEAKFKQVDSKEQINAYLIFDGKVFVEKIDANVLEQAQGSQGKQQKSTFRPTPLATAPRLGPAKWLKNEDEDEDKKK